MHFSHDTVIGRDTVVEPNVVFGPGVTVEEGARIRAFSHLEGCHVGSAVPSWGPMPAAARHAGERGPHRQFRRDQERRDRRRRQGQPPQLYRRRHLGAGRNVGAGTITCNYDGVMKAPHRDRGAGLHRVGHDACGPGQRGRRRHDRQRIGDHARCPRRALALSRPAQENKPGMARKLLKIEEKEISKRSG